VADPDGWRAGYLQHFLRVAGRDLPIAAGAGTSLTTGQNHGRSPGPCHVMGRCPHPPSGWP
jgi:hypothetical protein